MNKLFSIIILLITFQFSYCQDSIPYINKGFVISYKIKRVDETHSSVWLSIKNSSNENRYVSITKNDLFRISSEKGAFFDLSNQWNTDPLMNPKMLFHFAQIKKGETYEITRIIYNNNNAELLYVTLEYLSDLEKTAKKLKSIDSSNSIFTLKCKEYVDSAYSKGEIKQLSQKFTL